MLWATGLVTCLTAGSPAVADDDLGVRVPEGFEVALYADDDLAHDIYSMTVDSFGRVVVSGAGYVRILLDEDGDGRAESVRQYADGPRTGAQGMSFHGRDLLCAGDAGLIRYRDRDGDDRADGPPDEFLAVKAGGEHDLHAIRRGPDGWWYLIAGNMAGVDASYVTLEGSPVKTPAQGTLVRLKPDLTGGEVVAHGMRNAYDFDFTPAGDVFTYDSDGERDISLPWYRPTRVFHLTPGSHAGWLSRSWKRPDYFLDMPPVLAEFGRGSPTGVVCYRHVQFPEAYQGALFVLDWTYGRVFALPVSSSGSVWETGPIEFMTATGQHGFAPTDVAVGPDGSLFVSVGGRGTRGGVYRIRWADSPPVVPTEVAADAARDEMLTACLSAPQPLSSWSRRRWEPLAAKLGEQPFLEAAVDEGRSADERIRAIEIMTEKFHGLGSDLAQELSADSAPEIRARAVWSLGRTQQERPNLVLMEEFLANDHPLVVRCTLEALLGAAPGSLAPLVEPLARTLDSEDRFVRQAAARLLARVDEETYHAAAAAAVQHGWQAAVPLAYAFALRHPGFDSYPIDVGTRMLTREEPAELKLEAARLIQIGLGDVGPDEEAHPAVFDGYAAHADLAPHADALQPFAGKIAAIYPTGDALLDHELGRVLAMLQVEGGLVLSRVLAQVTADSHPVDDIHQLIVAARLPAERTVDQRGKIAEALLSLQSKIDQRGLRQDLNWDDRVQEMYVAHAEIDPELPVALLEHEDFGRPGHTLFLGAMPPDRVGDIIDAFVTQIRADDDYRWDAEIVFLLGAAEDPEVVDLVREKFDDFALRGAVLSSLANFPQEQDRERYLSGLETAPLDVLSVCIDALSALAPQDSPREVVTLLLAARRLGREDRERALRDRLIEMLRERTGRDFGYVLGRETERQQESIDRWTAWVAETYPEEYQRRAGATIEGLEAVRALLSVVDWDAGDPQRGAELYEARRCSQCHGSRRALGPDLAGVAGRFSREDLFTAIMLPNRDVSPRYQTTSIVDTDGRVYTGLVVYESVDGLVLRDSNNQTYRIETEDIETRRVLNTSLMPAGLLNDLSPQAFADLYAYLRTLGGSPAEAERTASSGE